MISRCTECGKYFEDEYRSWVCPHDAFPANDGSNHFEVHNESYLSEQSPTKEKANEEHSEC